jgi:hypothetical protein
MKYWEANVSGNIFTAPTLKALAVKLGIKPSQIEGVYYRKRLEEMIQIRKVVKEEKHVMEIKDISGNFIVSFD